MFASVGADTGAGQFLLAGEEKVVSDLGPKYVRTIYMYMYIYMYIYMYMLQSTLIAVCLMCRLHPIRPNLLYLSGD